ncbi:MAG TPA: hypothetical protein ENN20_07055 [Candidatus Marinimicrobia bacterium]|nr:hypothetical protein [Candidatus Neomarinimicrobiota bacterium]
MAEKDPGKSVLPNPLLSEEIFDYINAILESGAEKDEKEIKRILDSVMNLPIEKLRKRVNMTPRLEAKQLMYRAYEESEEKGRKLAQKALEIYPDCVDAYIYYGDNSEDAEVAAAWYQKAVKAGERDVGEKHFKESVGHFWGINVTRPYMRARDKYAYALLSLGRDDEAIAEYQDMLRLNSNDNQGIRFDLAPLLLRKHRYKEYYQLFMQFKNEVSFGWLYTYFLYSFKKYGGVRRTQEILLEAISQNPYIIEILCTDREYPDELSEYYSFGDEDEAAHYVASTLEMWMAFPKAVQFLFHFYNQYKDSN